MKIFKVKQKYTYFIDFEEWNVVQTNGALMKGRFGHSASYDHKTNIVFIYGGYVLGKLTSDLLFYDVGKSKWYVKETLSKWPSWDTENGPVWYFFQILF